MANSSLFSDKTFSFSQDRSNSFKPTTRAKFAIIGKAKRFSEYTDLESPGPGRYEPKVSSRIKSIKFGSGERKTFIFAAEGPGPGRYNTPLTRGPSFSFAPKLDTKLPSIPGPGSYNPKVIKPTNQRTVFGTEIRKDNFLDPELSSNPSPWNYNINPSANSPKWKFGREPRAKEQDLSKMGVFEALLHARLHQC
jgi:hypothetical protein